MTQNITQIENVIYTAKAHTACGREGGASRSSDVGWSTCFLSAIRLVAAKAKVANCGNDLLAGQRSAATLDHREHPSISSALSM